MKTDIIFILDKSGSMEHLTKDVIGSFRTFIRDQQKVDGECTMSLLTFDTNFNWIYKNRDIHNVPELEFSAGGNTALYDALGYAIESYEPSCKHCSGKTLFVIFTDGEENSSRKFNKGEIKKMIDHRKEGHNWDFVYLGANQDSFAEGGKISVSYGYIKNYTASPIGVYSAFSSLSHSVSGYRGTEEKVETFFEENV